MIPTSERVPIVASGSVVRQPTIVSGEQPRLGGRETRHGLDREQFLGHIVDLPGHLVDLPGYTVEL